MVLKSSKHGVYSGNTLRASNSLYNRQYRAHSSIVRRYIGGTEKKKLQIQQLIENFDIQDFDVEFSLNKRERWVLPEVIRKYIQSVDSPEDTTKTDLILRHKLKRQANCVAYYSDKGHIKRLVPKVGRYFDGKTATNYKTRQTKGKRGKKTVTDIDETLQPDSDESTVRYEVFCPCSPRSSIVHNPKYIKPEGRDSASATVNGGKKNKRRSRLTSRDVNEMLDDRSEDFDFLSEDDSDTGDVISRGNFTFRDFIKPERKTKRKSRTRRPSHEDDDSERKRSRIVFVDKDVSSARSVTAGDETYSQGENSPSVSLKDPTLVIPVAVKVDSNEAAFDNLQTVYGRRYTEAKCEPRKFSIDMTDKLRDHVRTSTFFRDVTSSSLDLHGYLTFTEVEGRDDATLSVYHVALNIASHMNSMKLETIMDMETYTLAQLEDRCLSYVDTLPNDVFVKRDAFNAWETPFMTFQLVTEGRRWNMNCIHPHEFSDNVCSLQGTYRDAAEIGSPPDVCGICYDDIRVSTESTDTPSPATSLDACGHWFCDSCWRQHLVSKLRSGPCALTCPEYGCSVEADFPTLLSFLHIGDVKKHIERQTSEKINCSAQAKWCPKPQCGRAILAEGLPIRNRSIPVVCSCGTDLCFACMKNAHWPASCAQAKQFREKVIALKDYVTLAKDAFLDPLPDAVAVSGKSCPKCKRFIEKISGCPNMSCPCGATFCWICSKATKPYERHDCVVEAQKNVLVEEYVYYPMGFKRTRFYSTALKHRQQRLTCNMFKHLSRTGALSKRLAADVFSHKKLRNQIRDYSQDDQPLFRLADNFLRRMLSVKLELHHVIENVAIAIDNMLPGSQPNGLMQTLTRMEACAATIEATLETGPSLSNSVLVDKLLICQKNARFNIARVAQLMK